MPHVYELNHPHQLELYRHDWQRLHAETREATLFQTLDWLQAYWRHFGENKQLRVLMVESQGRLIGILPLVVVPELTRVGKVRTLTYPLADWGTFFGPIGPNPTATLTLAMAYLGHHRRDWDLLDLRWVDRDGLDRQRTPGSMRHAGFAVRESIWKESALIELDGTFDDYWASRTAKFRNNLRRAEKRLAALGTVHHEHYRSDDRDPGGGERHRDVFEQCLKLARCSWQGSSPDGTTLSHPSVREFFRETHDVAAKYGCLDVHLLNVDGRPIAFSYNYVCRGQVLGIRTGYNPEFARTGAGSLLYARMIAACYAHGDHRLDLGTGSLEIKRPWQTHIGRSYRYTNYPLPAVRAQLLRCKHWWQARRSPIPQGRGAGGTGAVDGPTVHRLTPAASY